MNDAQRIARAALERARQPAPAAIPNKAQLAVLLATLPAPAPVVYAAAEPSRPRHRPVPNLRAEAYAQSLQEAERAQGGRDGHA